MFIDGKYVDENGVEHDIYANNDGGFWYLEDGKVVIVE